jgi:hypothetical protein
MQAASSSNIIINKTSKELLNDMNSNFLNFHESLNWYYHIC